MLREAKFSHLNKNRLIVIFLIIAATIHGGCMRTSQLELSRQQYLGKPRKELVHPNGLRLRIAEGLPVEQDSDSFSIEPQDEAEKRVRGSARVYVGFRTGQTPPLLGEPPANDFPLEQRLGERIIHYRETGEDSGGSGGKDYEFVAWEAVADGYIFYDKGYQQKYGQKDFRLCWHVIEGTSYEPQR